MTLKELNTIINKFIKKLESDRKSSHTISSYSYTLKEMSKHIEKNNPHEFDIKYSIMNYVDDMDSDYAEKTINSKRAAVRAFISYLKSRDYITEDFSYAIKNIKQNHIPPEILHSDEIEQVLKQLAFELKEAEGYNIYYKARNLTLFIFLLYTAARRSEAVQVKFSDIDFINDEIKVYGKGNKIRIVPLVPELKQQLYNFRDIIEKMHTAGYNVKSEYLFRSEKKDKKTKNKDNPMTPRNVLKIVKESCQKAGIEKNITAHSLRHTFASFGLQNGMNLKALSEILGHSMTSTTVNIYAHVISMDVKKKEMEKIRY